MKDLATNEGVSSISQRIHALKPDSQRLWGQMDAAQMLAHIRFPLEVPMGKHELEKSWFLKLIGPMIKKQLVKDQPIKKNSPTGKTIKVTDQRDFEQEKTALLSTLTEYSEFVKAGKLPPAHPYWGKLTSQEWNIMQYRHLDHHLGQFGV